MSALPDAFKQFMYNMVKETIECREQQSIVRKDFIQCLIQLRNTGNVNTDDSSWNSDVASDGRKAFTIEQCAAQVGLLYLAGFDTTASAVANTLYELTQNIDLMKRLQHDIDETLAKHDGIVSYDAVQEIALLDLCVLGMFPPPSPFSLPSPRASPKQQQQQQQAERMNIKIRFCDDLNVTQNRYASIQRYHC